MDVQISLYLFSLFVFYQPNTNWVSVYLSLYCLFLSLYQCISQNLCICTKRCLHLVSGRAIVIETRRHRSHLLIVEFSEFGPQVLRRTKEHEVGVDVNGRVQVGEHVRQEEPLRGAHSEHVAHILPSRRVPHVVVLEGEALLVLDGPVRRRIH